MASTGENQTETLGLPVVGQEGDTCEQCGSVLATDQRYCLNCGWRRGETRVDYENRLNGGTYVNGAAPANGAVAVSNNPQWTPAFAILAIALLGVMLLLGVLIGKKGNNNTQTVAAQAAPTTTAAAAAPTNTTATTADKSAKSGKGGGGGAPGQGNVVQGGSGSTAGIQAANTGASVEQNAKSGPNVVATQGKPAALDPNGQAGGGSSATCIGC
jgi:hypothetical protein